MIIDGDGVTLFPEDLTPEAQKEILAAFKLDSFSDANWDSFGIALVPFSDEDLD